MSSGTSHIEQQRRQYRISACAVRIALPACAILGVTAAFAVVLAWFPHIPAAWNNPLQEIDAPAHYYFIRKILDEGLPAITRLWPNDAYYPPLFHLLAAGLIKLAALFGVQMNVYAAVNVIWLATSGILWPAGMSLLASYWTCRRLREASSASRQQSCAPRALVSPCSMAILVPLLSVASASHPFQMLASGPLVAYGLATTLLPFWLYATLRLLDAIASVLAKEAHPRAKATVLIWTLLMFATGALCLFAHPRIAFTWLLFIGPFILMRMPWKLVVAAALVVVLGAVAFFAYMVTHFQSSRYLNPAEWFHTFVPNRTVKEALGIVLSDNIPGFAGGLMVVGVVLALAITIAALVNPRAAAGWHPRITRKDAASLLMVFSLVMLVYVCSTSLTGWFPNIVAGAWYRAETRPLTMIPLGVVPLLVFAVSAVVESRVPSLIPGGHVAVRPIAIMVAAALAIVPQFGNTTREALSASVAANMELTDNPPDEQLTETKVEVLRDVARTVGPDATVISDPLNGSMYGTAMFGTNMLYPIYNPMTEKNGAIFRQVEDSFESGDAGTVRNIVCPIGTGTSEYFLVMGPQAPSLAMFTFKAQYDPFHDESLIQGYLEDGVLELVRDYSTLGEEADGWALYRFNCQ